jgi:5-enolpyruvylshikimate-3-phosphate synthase
MKETGRVSVMIEELGKLGFKTTKSPDGLIVHGAGKIPRSQTADPQAPLKLDSKGDPCVVMALACAALGLRQPVEISGAETAVVAYPGFLEILHG